MIQFKPASHTVHPWDIVEIWMDGKFVGAIYPHGENGIRLISRYCSGVVVGAPRDEIVQIDFDPNSRTPSSGSG